MKKQTRQRRVCELANWNCIFNTLLLVRLLRMMLVRLLLTMLLLVLLLLVVVATRHLLSSFFLYLFTVYKKS